MKKILFGALASSALLLTACSTSEEVASTEAGKIREDDLYEAMKNERLQSGMTIGETVLNQILIKDILENSYGDQVADEKVTEELEKSAEPYGGIEEYEKIMEAQGVDIDSLKDDMRLNFLIEEAVKDNIEITEKEIEETYEELKPDATAQHILVEDKETAEDLIAQLNDGADFTELVKEHSIDPGAAEEDGKYSFSKGEMVPEFEEAVFNLEEGERTDEPVETQSGYHIIRRLELEYAPLDEQKEDVKETIITQHIEDQEFMNDLISDLVKDANVQISDEELEGAVAMYMTPEDEENSEEQEEPEETEDEEEKSKDEEEEAETDESTEEEK